MLIVKSNKQSSLLHNHILLPNAAASVRVEDSTLLNLLQSCITQKDLSGVCRVHKQLLQRGLLKNDIYLGRALVNVFSEFGEFTKANSVLEELETKDLISWTLLIKRYVALGDGLNALNCFGRMQHRGLHPDAVTFVCVLKACTIATCDDIGKQVHAEIVRIGLSQENVLVGTALVDMYVKCDAVVKAQEVFDELNAKDVVSWNAIISGYAQSGYGEEALWYFERMKCESLFPNAVTFVCVLKACSTMKAIEKGVELHAEIVELGLFQNNILVGNTLVDMYAKCGDLTKAQEVFDELLFRNIISWTALIAGYTQHDWGEAAVKCFQLMQCQGISANQFTYIYVLRACGNIGAAEQGTQTHVNIIKEGFLEKDTVLFNALVDMYAKCGLLLEAYETFNEIPDRNIVSWNVLIAGCAEHSNSDDAFRCFKRMQCESFIPNDFTFVCILKSCGKVGAMDKGHQIHAEVLTENLLHEDIVVGNALIDMYAKCGAPGKTQRAFNELLARDIISWTVLLAGYAQLGNDEIVIDLLNKMIFDNVEPNWVTFTVILSSCSHSGLLDEGQRFFEIMINGYGIIPTIEHYTCIIDLFGRAGSFYNAVTVIEKMPISDYLPIWTSILGASRKWGNLELGMMAYEHAIQLVRNYAGACLCMNSIYVALAMEENV